MTCTLAPPLSETIFEPKYIFSILFLEQREFIENGICDKEISHSNLPQSSCGFLLDNSFNFFSSGKNPARKANSLLHPTKTEKGTQRISQSTRLAIHGWRFSCSCDQCKSTDIECYKPAGCGSSSCSKSFNGSV